jgi:hypothetical protein
MDGADFQLSFQASERRPRSGSVVRKAPQQRWILCHHIGAQQIVAVSQFRLPEFVAVQLEETKLWREEVEAPVMREVRRCSSSGGTIRKRVRGTHRAICATALPTRTCSRHKPRDGNEKSRILISVHCRSRQNRYVRKFFNLLMKANGYVLEQLYSPIVVYTTPEHEELKAIARGCITRHHAHHSGFAESRWQLFQKDQPPRVKPLLYVFRVLLTGIPRVFCQLNWLRKTALICAALRTDGER